MNKKIKIMIKSILKKTFYITCLTLSVIIILSVIGTISGMLYSIFNVFFNEVNGNDICIAIGIIIIFFIGIIILSKIPNIISWSWKKLHEKKNK